MLCRETNDGFSLRKASVGTEAGANQDNFSFIQAMCRRRLSQPSNLISFGTLCLSQAIFFLKRYQAMKCSLHRLSPFGQNLRLHVREAKTSVSTLTTLRTRDASSRALSSTNIDAIKVAVKPLRVV
jgi:hypothetical protein